MSEIFKKLDANSISYLKYWQSLISRGIMADHFLSKAEGFLDALELLEIISEEEERILLDWVK